MRTINIQTILSLQIFPLALLLEIPRNYTQPQSEGHPVDTFKIAAIDLTPLAMLTVYSERSLEADIQEAGTADERAQQWATLL